MNRSINDVKQERARVLEHQRKIVEKCLAEKRSETTDERTLGQILQNTEHTLDEEIRKYEIAESENKRSGRAVDVGGNSTTSFRNWINRSLTGEIKDAYSVNYTTELRSDPLLSTTNPNINLKTVASTDVMVSASQQLLQDLGVRFITNLTGTVTIPWMSEDLAVFVNENDSATSASMDVSTNSISPRRLAHTQTITKEAIANTTDDFLNTIMNNLVSGCWNAVANDFFDTLDVDAPNSVKNIKGSYLTFEDIVGLEASVGNYTMASPRYVMTNTTKAYLKKTSALTNNSGAIWEKGIVNEYPAFGTTAVNGNRLYYGDFSKAVVGIWQGVQITIDPFTMASEGKIKFIADMLVDSGVYNPKAFSIIADASTH